MGSHYKRYVSTVLSNPAVSGASIDSGSSAVQWANYLAQTFAWLNATLECEPPVEEADKRKFGHSRDRRSDCVQVVIALIVTPEGFPLACEVLAGNTSDKTTLGDFLKEIEAQYGKAQRTRVMDRGHAACGITVGSPARKSSPRCEAVSHRFIIWSERPKLD